jgi:trehalose/maltose hydrolase-like predicted phosphorylase
MIGRSLTHSSAMPEKPAALGLVLVLAVGVAWSGSATAVPSPSRSAPRTVQDSAWVLSTADPSLGGAPTFIGNGYLAERIPAEGSGYASTPVDTQSQVAGFYAHLPGETERRATLPTWSTLGFSDGLATFGALPTSTAADGVCSAPAGAPGINEQPCGQWKQYRQALNLRTGVLTTTLEWVSPGGRTTDLKVEATTDQARAHVAAVRLSVTPHWTGTSSVTDMLDGTGMRRARLVSQGVDPVAREQQETVAALGTGTTLSVASRLEAQGSPRRTTQVHTGPPGSSAQAVTVPLGAGHTYVFTKYVGIATSGDADRGQGQDPSSRARHEAAVAATRGWGALIKESTSAWSKLWRGNITVIGDPTLTSQARAAMFYLLESNRAGVNSSTSPSGLSSDSYSGHVFWDAETWMYPALLAMHPDIAAGVDTYRQTHLGAAQQYAGASALQGARFPWESAASGSEQAPPPFGTDEQHITADVVLAQWQYYEATHDRQWLKTKAWPVIRAAADFWTSRATPSPLGGYDIDHVMPPDEYHTDVNNSAYTDAAVSTALRIAAQAASVVNAAINPAWLSVAGGLRVPFDPATGVHPEFDGYTGETIKQADVVMLQYPWQYPMRSQVAATDLNYYIPRVDASGPSMTDAIHSIDAAALGDATASYQFLVRSAAPFERGPFDQFAETRSGGAFTFLTGMGGFLQEFLYGFTGLRWDTNSVKLDPTLPAQMAGLTISGLAWQGRHFDIDIGPSTTTIRLTSGASIPIVVAGGARRELEPGRQLTVATRRTVPSVVITP